jgi:serine protease DegQ
LGDAPVARECDDRVMTSEPLTVFSNAMADAVAAAAPSVVQVQGRRRPASGLVYADGIVVTTMRALGREDGLHVRRGDGAAFAAELAGWDPTTTLAVLRVPELAAPSIAPASEAPRVGHLALAVARSWSNVVTASAGIVAVIGGPLRTGHRRAIDQIFRTTAPMHDGFAGGAFLDTRGGLLGVATSTEIRGTTVVIPASIAWTTVASVLEHGSLKRGYLGVAGQPVEIPEGQRRGDQTRGFLVAALTADGPAAKAGVFVGDLITGLDGHAVTSPEGLFDLLLGDRVGREVPVRLLRGGSETQLPVIIGERPKG